MRIISGLKWNLIKAIGSFLIKFIYGVIVAKILGPVVIGKMGMIVVFSGFASIFINSGFKSRIVQVEEINDKELNTIFVFNSVMGAVLTALLFLTSDIIAHFFNYPEIGFYIKIYSFNFLLQSLILVPLAVNDRNLDFNKNTKSILLASLLALCVAMTLIFLGFELLSLVIYALASNIFSIIFIYGESEWFPKYFFQYSLLKRHLPYSLNLLFVRIFEEFVTKIDNIVTGKYFDANSLGLFSKSKDIAKLPNSLITSSVNNTLFPYFSRSGKDTESAKSIYNYLLFGVTFLYLNVFLSLIYFNKEIIMILLSEEWLLMMPYFKIALIIMMVKGVSSFKGYFILSRGDSKVVSKALYISGGTKILLMVVLLLIIDFTPIDFLYITLFSEVVLFLIYEKVVTNIIVMNFFKSFIKNVSYHLAVLFVYFLIFLVSYLVKLNIFQKVLLYTSLISIMFFGYYKYSNNFKFLISSYFKK